MKKTHLYTVAVLAVALCCLISLWLYVLFSPVVTSAGGSIYYLRPGISKRSVISELSQQGIIKHPFMFSLYAYPHKSASLKVGEYFFPEGATPYSIWKQLTTGTGLYYRHFTIIPGWTFRQLRAGLSKAQGLKHLISTLNDQQIMQRLGRPELSPEGEFFPDTYNYTRGDIDLAILKRAFDLMQNKLNEDWQRRAAGLPYRNPYDALIAASMIEKEGYLDAERPLISSVLINRLKKDMLLQIDATVIYGLADRYDGKIHKTDLLEDTPYNTYIHKGLPPTPIAMPGSASIEAALHPQPSDYYYYVAKGDGGHQFSTSLQAHNAAVQATMSKPGDNFNESVVRRHMAPMLGLPVLPGLNN
ncbi:hypothetical protein AQUSIP_12160 [Aquicella siphonis]|uniref:Endolytic murein transglycosylase n=1 Tax=Aquicella siphonis TaxID=254247 RepID=A0A5E4PH45_9COXI|nr:endolytic transglycosylase MltG [Aquicella siphonis]VVC75915.1 hypothetical protein AQUSIP_12160 [Aquicella siphonis]